MTTVLEKFFGFRVIARTWRARVHVTRARGTRLNVWVWYWMRGYSTRTWEHARKHIGTVLEKL